MGHYEEARGGGGELHRIHGGPRAQRMNIVRERRGQEVGARIDPGHIERQLGEDPDQRLSDVPGTV